MADVRLCDVHKIFPGGFAAVRGIDLDIADGELIVLVGPSGCGKSTTLRMIAGLEEVTSGDISIGNRKVNDVAPKDRDIAMVFQNYALYPHMTVFDNMAFSLKTRRRELRLSRADIRSKVRDVARLLDIEDLLSQKPKVLSGGQRQRVAVGRAIVRSPKVFLFDEPLSNLDAKLRVEMRTEIKRLQRSLRTTTIYVTHDQEEAMTLGDRVVVMKDGVIHQCGAPIDIYHRPANRFVAGFVGMPAMSFLDARLDAEGRGIAAVVADGRLELPEAQSDRLRTHVGKPVVMGIRPEAVRRKTEDAPCTMTVSVDLIESLGNQAIVHVSTATGAKLVGRCDPESGFKEGERVPVTVYPSGVHFFSAGPEGRNLGFEAGA